MKAFVSSLLFLLTICFPSPAWSVQELNSSFSVEHCDSDALAGGSVNVLSGKLLVSERDCPLFGPEEIAIQRHYLDHEAWSFFPHTLLMLGESDEKAGYSKEGLFQRYMKAVCGEASGSVFAYYGWIPEGKDGLLRCVPQGMTNCSQKEIGGKTHFKNISLTYVAQKDLLELRAGDGSRRVYTKGNVPKGSPLFQVLDGPLYRRLEGSLQSPQIYFLQSEVRPNGNKTLYFYDQQGLLIEIRATNATEKNVLAFVRLEYFIQETSARVVVKTSAGNEIQYLFDCEDGGEFRLKCVQT